MLKNATRSDSSGNLGQALRLRRKELGLTQQAVADGAGLTVGFISQVERGLASPSLSSLVAMAEVLETPISAFLAQPGPSQAGTRSGNRKTYSVPGSSDASYERVSSSFPGSRLHSVVVHEPPGYRSEPISHRGEEMFFVLAGELMVEIDGRREILRAGDSIHFDSRRVHSSWNHTARTTTMLWCGTMDIFGDGGRSRHPHPTMPPGSGRNQVTT